MNYLFIDVETTGLGSDDRIIEVAVVERSNDSAPAIVFESVINPERNIRNRDIHAVNNRFLRHAPKFSEIASHLARTLNGRCGVAHNAAFDSRMLVSEFARVGIDANLPLGCTLRMAPAGPKAKRTLSDLARRLSIAGGQEDGHRASTDATLAASVFFKLLEAAGGHDDIAPIRIDTTSARLPEQRATMNREENRLVALRLNG